MTTSPPEVARLSEADSTAYSRLYTSFIDGQYVGVDPDAERIELEDPATRSPYGLVSAASPDQVEEAVKSAHRAQGEWWAVGPTERTRRLVAWAALIRSAASEIADLDVQAVGRLRDEALADVVKSADQIDYWAHEGPQLVRRSERSAVPGHLFLTSPAPVGVAGLLLPANVPSRMFLVHSAVALGCGNAVVVKPADISPASALRLAELAVEAGLPAGLVNVVIGGPATGAALAASETVGGISFTGSTATGRRVAAAVAERFGKTALELGGKSPQIVFPDTDLSAAAEAIVWSFCANAGQICTAGSRALVHVDVYDELVERVVALAAGVRVGHPADPATHIGPLSSRRQFERVVGLVDRAKAQARLALGGEPVHGLPGYYFAPTIFADVPSTAEIFQEEVFGPVLCMTPFSDEVEAVALANDSQYALAANVWTADLRRAVRIAERLETGTVWCNTSRLADPHMPLRAGRKSGNSHARGLVDVFTEEKLMVVALDDKATGPNWALAAEGKA